MPRENANRFPRLLKRNYERGVNFEEKGQRYTVMSQAENFRFDKSASIAFDRSNANMG